MPIYEYRCENCGVFEVTRRITEPALKRCPTCKGKVERLMSATSFVLKGSGWYATDYASGARSKTDGDAGASETKASDTKAGDSKSNGATDSSSTDSAKSASGSATKSGDSSSSAKASAPEPVAKSPGKSSGKSKPSASKSAD